MLVKYPGDAFPVCKWSLHCEGVHQHAFITNILHQHSNRLDFYKITNGWAENSTKSFPKNKHVICVEKKKKFFKIFFEATQDQLFKHCNILERLRKIQFELLSWNFFACTDSESSKIKLTTYVLYLLLFAKDNPWRRLFSKRLSPKIAYFLFKANLLGNRN